MTGAPPSWESWLAVCGLRREAAIWGGRAVVGGGRSDLLEQRLTVAIAAQRPAGLISFGVCGALSPKLAVGDLVIGRSVTGPDDRVWTCDPAVADRLAASTGGRLSDLAAADRVVADPVEKQALSRRSSAVDMESHVAARAADGHGLSFAVLRVVSDAAGDSLPAAAVAGMRPDGGVDVTAVLSALARDPRQLPALIRLGRDSGRAFAVLQAARKALG